MVLFVLRLFRIFCVFRSYLVLVYSLVDFMVFSLLFGSILGEFRCFLFFCSLASRTFF